MSGYKWVNDWSRYSAIDSKGALYEYEAKPYTRNNEWVMDSGPAKRISGGDFPDARWRESLQQRYTDQQMELEADGWTPWNAGDGIPKIELSLSSTLAYEFIFNEMYGEKFARNGSWDDDVNPIIAYRLSNADGYKDGVKVEQSCHEYKEIDGDYILQNKPEWKAGELPPVGTVCEGKIAISPSMIWKWRGVEVLKHLKSECVVYLEAEGRVMFCDDFRPIQTDKERVIDRAVQAIDGPEVTAGDLTPSLAEFISDLYDAGALIDPDKGEE